MMNKILLLSLLVTPAFAQDSAEEAIILNQELQFLEETANNVSIITAGGGSRADKASNMGAEDLEQQYFGEQLSEDGVSTKVAAPKRRSY